MSLQLKRQGRRQLMNQSNGYVPINPEVSGWVNMIYYVATASVDNNTIQAVDNFVTTLKGQQVWSLMTSINVFAQSSLNTVGQNQRMALIPLLSPLYISPIALPWQSSGGTPLINTTGYCPNGNFYINTFLPFSTTFPNSNSNGISIYHASGSFSSGMWAGTSNGFTTLFFIQQPAAGGGNPVVTGCDILLANDWATPSFSSSATGISGFYSMSRTAATTASLYKGNSSGFFSGSSSFLATSPSSNLATNLTIFQLQTTLNSLWYCPNTFMSFVAFHQGLTQNQTQILFNAVQTMRQQMGGGWV